MDMLRGCPMAEVLTGNLGVWGGSPPDSIAGELHFELDRMSVLMYTEVEGTKDIFGLHEKITSSIFGSQMDQSPRSFRHFLGWG